MFMRHIGRHSGSELLIRVQLVGRQAARGSPGLISSNALRKYKFCIRFVVFMFPNAVPWRS